MSVEQLEQTVRNLSPADRRRFLEWLYEHEDELVAPDDVHPELKAEILRRRDEARAHPDKLEPWSDAFSRMKQRFDDLWEPNFSKK